MEQTRNRISRNRTKFASHKYRSIYLLRKKQKFKLRVRVTNFPHTVLEAFGIGQFIHALDNELHGRPWEAPPLPSEINVVQEALDDLEAAPSLFDCIHRESATYAGLRRDFTKSSFMNNLSNSRAFLSEFIWGRIEDKSVYLNGKTLGKLLREVKDEVRTIDGGSVTTSDILVAWILKAMYANESDMKPVSLISAISIRRVLGSKYPAMKDYSRTCTFLGRGVSLIDNAIMFSPLPSFTKQQLAEQSLAELAILHRQRLETTTNEAWIQAYNRHDEPWMFTNQAIGRIDQIEFGSKMT
ncbi:hypothetical protein H0H93_015279 [Arthromyces matolae]|nr:hypothetical protein H0H93_015279 [Arthromyces matolae]